MVSGGSYIADTGLPGGGHLVVAVWQLFAVLLVELWKSVWPTVNTCSQVGCLRRIARPTVCLGLDQGRKEKGSYRNC